MHLVLIYQDTESGELRALMDRFAKDLALIFLTNSFWRAPSSDGQIFNGLDIEFFTELSFKYDINNINNKA